MQKRSPATVLILTFVTFGIYALIWMVKTKNEMNAAGANIPTAWLLIVPIANLYWLWMWCNGIEYVSKEKMSAALAFVIHSFLPFIGMAIIQDTLNKSIDRGLPMQPAELPMARLV